MFNAKPRKNKYKAEDVIFEADDPRVKDAIKDKKKCWFGNDVKYIVKIANDYDLSDMYNLDHVCYGDPLPFFSDEHLFEINERIRKYQYIIIAKDDDQDYFSKFPYAFYSSLLESKNPIRNLQGEYLEIMMRIKTAQRDIRYENFLFGRNKDAEFCRKIRLQEMESYCLSIQNLASELKVDLSLDSCAEGYIPC